MQGHKGLTNGDQHEVITPEIKPYARDVPSEGTPRVRRCNTTVALPVNYVGGVETAPVVAGFDAGGDWHDDGNGRFAKPGWSSAKALAIRAVRGAFALGQAKDNPDGVWLKSADNYLSRVGVNNGQAVKVRYDNDEYGLIDAVHPDGTTKPVRVKWERFADELPDLPHDLLRKALEAGPTHKKLDDGTWTDFRPDFDLEQQVRSAFEHDLGDGWYTSATVKFSSMPSAYVHNAVNHLAVSVSFHRRSDGLGRNAEIAPGVTLQSQLGIAYRTIALLPDGKIILSNDNIKIKKPAPKGLGTRFLHATESKLAAIGVQEAHVGAMTDAGTGMVGAYVAARQGYDWGRAQAPWELGYLMRQVDPDNALAARLVAPFEKRAAEIQIEEPEFELTRKALINASRKFADVQLPDDYPTPNDAAIDPVGKQILLGRVNSAGEWDYEAPGGAFTWSGIKRLDVATESTPRIETPAVTKNTTKTVAGVGDSVRDRIIAAGGTGTVTVADNYLNRHGYPKGMTVTVERVDDTWADIVPLDGRKLRVKWARFTPTETPDTPTVAPSGVDETARAAVLSDIRTDETATAILPPVFEGNPVERWFTRGERNVTGPPHLERTEHRAVLDATIQTPSGANRVTHQFTVSEGTDGKPFISMFDSSFGDIANRFADEIAARVGVDERDRFPPQDDPFGWAQNGGWRFSSDIGVNQIHDLAKIILTADPGNRVGLSWAKWDGDDQSSLLQPSDMDDATVTILRNGDAAWPRNLTAVKSLTDREGLFALPATGDSIRWGDVKRLPPGTRIVPETTGDHLTTTADGLGYGWENPDVESFKRDGGITRNGTFSAPGFAVVFRYENAPLPEVPPAPEPFPGVDVPEGTVPSLPLVHVGLVVGGDAGYGGGPPKPRLAHLPPGTHVRRVDENRQKPYKDDFDFVINGDGKRMHAVHDRHKHEGSRRIDLQPSNSEWMVTAVPTNKPSRMMTEAQQVRVRKALLAAAAERSKAAKARGDYGTNVDDIAVGAVHPNDWLTSDGSHKLLSTAVSMKGERLSKYQEEHANGVGPLWRIQSDEGDSNTAILVDTPIDGVEPEVVSASRINGMLSDEDGVMLWVDRFSPTRWAESQPSTLSDETIAARLAAMNIPPAPASLRAVNKRRKSPQPFEIADWLRDQNLGRTSDLVPPKLVKVSIDKNNPNKLIVDTFEHPLGTPEADRYGYTETGDPHTLTLPIDDPRLIGVLNNVWWENHTTNGDVAKVETAMRYGIQSEIEGLFSYDRSVIEEALFDRSHDLIRANTVDNNVNVRLDGTRFVVDPNGTPVDRYQVQYAETVGGQTVVSLNQKGVEAVVGGSLTPDYTTVLDDTLPWGDRVTALKEQATRLAVTHPPALNAWFAGVGDNIEDRLDAPSDNMVENFDRVGVVSEHGRAVTALIKARAKEILEDPTRDNDHKFGPLNLGMASRQSAQQIIGLMDQIKDDPAYETISELNDTTMRFRKRGTRFTVSNFEGTGDTVMFNYRFEQIRSIDVLTSDGQVRVHPVDDPDVGKSMYRDLDHIEARESSARSMFSKVSTKKPSAHQLAFTETLEALGIDMGTDPDIQIFSGKSSKARKIGTSSTLANTVAEVGLAPYPKDWTSTLVGRPQRIVTRTDGSFAAGGGWNRGGLEIHVPHPDRFPQHADTLVHEFGHTMEYTVPGLREAEQWFMASRLAAMKPGDRKLTAAGSLHGRTIMVYKNMFKRSYSSRIYDQEGIHANKSFELFTTAMEQALKDPEGTDESLLEWVTGLLALFRPV